MFSYYVQEIGHPHGYDLCRHTWLFQDRYSGRPRADLHDRSLRVTNRKFNDKLLLQPKR